MALSDKEYYNLTVSISKALSSVEMPLKSKHARAAIIGTFHSRGAHALWAIAIRQPLQENRIVAWKFCHLLHKVLREGHPLCCQHSIRHRTMLGELGKLWGHLTDGYGQCIKQYIKLLLTKLEFHDRNPRFPGNLQLKRGQLTQIAGNDINFYFQLAVEMFDYLDDILSLQSTIFSSISMYRVNSMTPTGQCRLAPLIPLIQDSNQLYDFVVRIMFKLHAHLANELLIGHRERFRQIFQQLKKFFQQSSDLQYFVNLITIPRIPDNPPNFMSQVDFGAYIPPVVVVPEPPESEPIIENLIDTTDQQQPTSSQESASVQRKAPEIDFREIIKERDELIQHLQFEIERLGKHIKVATIETREKHSKFEEEIASLKSELTNKQEEFTNERLNREELELKVQIASIEKKAPDVEERARQSEEKFQKLKTMYTQIRDEHVKLLRTNGEVTKNLAAATKKVADAINEKEEMRTRLEDSEKLKEELIQQSDKSNEIDELKKRIDILELEKTSIQAKYEDLEANKSAEIAELSINLDRIKNELIEFEKQALLADKLGLDINVLKDEHRINIESKDKEIVQMKANFEEMKSKMYNDQEMEKLSTLKTINSLEMTLKDTTNQNSHLLSKIYKQCLIFSRECSTRQPLNEMSSPLYFDLISKDLSILLTEFNSVYDNYKTDQTTIAHMIETIVKCGFLMSIVNDQCVIICSGSADIKLSENILDRLKTINKKIITFYECLSNDSSNAAAITTASSDVQTQLVEMTSMIDELCSKMKSTDQIGDQIEAELSGMEKSIDEAAKKIEAMLSQSRAKDSGIKLEVNEKILDACTTLMQCIRMLVQKSRLLQAEIISLGKGSASVKEFYKRNHQWTEGLISAAKAVAQGANFLVTAANKSVAGDAKHQLDLIVAAQEIAASTAQLVVASRVKAPRGSTNLTALGEASRNVTQATGAVVAIAKDGGKILEESQDMDLSTLTVHQAKTLEMEMQVKIIELEQSLTMERLRLAAFRRKNYQAPSESINH